MIQWLFSVRVLVVGLVFTWGIAQGQQRPAGTEEGRTPLVAFLIGEGEYEALHTMPLLAGELETHYGMRTALVFDQRMQESAAATAGERAHDLQGIEVLREADLAVLFLHARTLPEAQAKILQEYVDAGKPVVGLRSSLDCFRYASDDALAGWNQFPQRVFGAHRLDDYGQESSTDVVVNADEAAHPILQGLPGSFHVRSWLYQVVPDIAPSAVVLLKGKSVGAGKDEEAGRAVNPVAWTFTTPAEGRVFFTTLGHQEDFESEPVRRLVLNGIHWALGLAPPTVVETAVAPPAFSLHDGDRVLFVGNTFVERDNHFAYLETLLTSCFPQCRLVFRNLGWSGDTVDLQPRPLGFGDLETQVRNQSPTVLFLSYGLNESYEGPARAEEFVAGYMALLDKLAPICPRIILLGPIPHEAAASPSGEAANQNENLRLYSEAIAAMAARRGCGFVDLFSALGAGRGDFPAPLTDNGIHLNNEGYQQAARAIAQALGVASASWKCDITLGNAGGEQPLSLEMQGLTLERLEWGPVGLRFRARAETLPWIHEDGNGGAQSLSARVLAMGGLAPGQYTLKVDGEAVATASAAEWAAGRAIDGDADVTQAAELRQEILSKDWLFFLRWRAHNGEYIYGRRAHTGQGNAGNPQFQNEHAEFDRLIAEAEARIHALAQPVAHEFELGMEN